MLINPFYISTVVLVLGLSEPRLVSILVFITGTLYITGGFWLRGKQELSSLVDLVLRSLG